jgi:ariadne-1
MEDWKNHNSNTGGYYKCNRYKPDELAQKTKETDREVARRELEKYMHYFKRYANHDKSQKFEKQLREKVGDKMKELQQLNKYSSWVDVEYVEKAVQTLCECRGSLKYTYVYGYYLDEGQEKNLFEYLQEDLERVTERLSEILESTPVEKFDRDEIISTTRSAATRLEHLLDGSTHGLVTERN